MGFVGARFVCLWFAGRYALLAFVIGFAVITLRL